MSNVSNLLFPSGLGKNATTAAGTVINQLVPALEGYTTVVTGLKYTDGGTAHTITALRPLGSAKVASAAAVNASTIVLDQDPSPSGNTIGNGDYFVVRSSSNGAQRVYKTHASTGWTAATKTVTLAAGSTVLTALAAGDPFWFLGVASDSDPVAATTHPGFTSNQTITDTVVGTLGEFQPIVLQSDNATTAGNFNYVQYAYCPKRLQ